MAERATDPIRVFIGLDSAPTEEDRVRLRHGELTGQERLAASCCRDFTGTGYVNHVAVVGGDHTRRLRNSHDSVFQAPITMSVDRVGRPEAISYAPLRYTQSHQMRPRERPRMVVFGESLGAHTS
jgi:uncharacterized membrane protein